MEPYILDAFLGAVMFGLGGVLFKWNAHNLGDDNYFFGGLYSVGATCFFIDGFDTLSELNDAKYFIMAAIVGLGAAGGNFALSQGMRYGPAGLTSAFAKANIIIVILLSSVYYGETITWIEGLGILFFFLAMIVVNLKVNKLNKPTNRTWVLIMMACIILLAFRNGGIKVVNELGLSGVLVAAVAYTYCAMVSIMLILKNRTKPSQSKVTKLKTAVIGILTGIVSYGGLYFYITAIKGGPGSVVITIFSLDMFFILLLSYLLFGERLNRNQIFGFLLSAIGLILIGLK